MAEPAPSYRRVPQRTDPRHFDVIESLASGSSTFWAIAAIVVFAVAFGGGGSKYGLANLIVQIAALFALSFHRRAFFDFWKSAPAAMTVLIGLSLLLPLAFLIPLPESVWTALPGRELMAQSFDLIGGKSWATASVDPIRTLLALSALIVPIALLSIGWSAQRPQLILLGWVVVALGLVNFLIGIPQVLSNSETGVIYPENPMPGVLFGSFANRNSAGLFLVGALALAALLPAPSQFGRATLGIRIAACLLLVVAIILTKSRTALVLAFLPIGLVALNMIFTLRVRSGPQQGITSRKALFVLVPVALIAGTLALTLFAAPGRMNDVIERFDDSDDARAYIWEDAVYSADRYWPIGSGTGTFDDVFQVDESLENMTPRRAGRAHNDYLEVAIEAGLPGTVLIAAWLILLVWLSWRARKSQDRWIAWSGAVILLTIALQSITDYPLRNMTMLAFGSFALLILARFGAPKPETANQEVSP